MTELNNIQFYFFGPHYPDEHKDVMLCNKAKINDVFIRDRKPDEIKIHPFFECEGAEE